MHHLSQFWPYNLKRVEKKSLSSQYREQKASNQVFAMAIDEESTFSTYMQELSAGLAAAAAANAECMMPSGADKEMKKLSESVLQIAHLSKDAKAKQRKELEEIICEVDSILQLFSLKGGSDKIPCNRRANSRTAQEVKAIRMRIDKISRKPHFLGNHTSTDHGITKMAVSHFPLEPLIVLGKNEDHEKITDMLLSVKDTELAGPCIIPIDRKDRAGTTELARAIFDDKRVVNHFKRRMWVSAGEIVDPKKLSRLIRKPAGTLFWVHKTLNEDSEEEQVLLVLDDIRNKNIELKKQWIREQKPKPWVRVNSTETKHKIVVSTTPLRDNPFYRDAVVPEESPSSRVETLSERDSWMLFKECALSHGNGSAYPYPYPQLEAIGKNIIQKLEGSRWTIRNVGELLSAKLEVSYWKLIMESQVWKLPFDEEVVQPTLAGICYRPWMPGCQHFYKRYAGSKSGEQSIRSLFWKRARC